MLLVRIIIIKLTAQILIPESGVQPPQKNGAVSKSQMSRQNKNLNHVLQKLWK
jgi:hypothetical protein